MLIKSKLILVAFVTLFLSFSNANANANGEFPQNGLTEVDIPSMQCLGWFHEVSWQCKPIKVPVYMEAPTGPSKQAVVIVSHGSEGITLLERWYIDHLAKQGYVAIAVDHWTPRGIGKAQYGYAKASMDQGGNSMNQAIDVMAVAHTIRNDPRFKGYKIGFMGESMGGGTARELDRDGYINDLVPAALGYKEKPLDAFVALYMGCDTRSPSDRFLNKPMLLINGELDDDTPLAPCQKWVSWLNSRGGDGKIIVIPNAYHQFDSWYFLQYFPKPQNPSSCASVIDYVKGTITDDKTGRVYPNNVEGWTADRKVCMKYGLHAGSRNSQPGNGFELWTDFFNKYLALNSPVSGPMSQTMESGSSNK